MNTFLDTTLTMQLKLFACFSKVLNVFSLFLLVTMIKGIVLVKHDLIGHYQRN